MSIKQAIEALEKIEQLTEHGPREYARAALAALRSMPTTLGKGITRDDTVHGEEYFTRSQVEAVRSMPAEPVAESWEHAGNFYNQTRHALMDVGANHGGCRFRLESMAKELRQLMQATPHTEAVRMSEAEIDAITNAQWGEQIGAMYAAYRAYARAVEQATAARLGVKMGDV